MHATEKRNEALENLKKKSYDKETIKNDIEYVCNKLSIEIEELKVLWICAKKFIKTINHKKIYGWF